MKRQRLLTCLVLIALTASAIWYFAGHVSAEEVNALIKREIPAGASAAEVKAFLSANGMTHSGPIETDVVSDFPSSSYPGRKRVVSASLKGCRVGSIFSDGIFINFLFDKEDRLIDYRVREVFTWM